MKIRYPDRSSDDARLIDHWRILTRRTNINHLSYVETLTVLLYDVENPNPTSFKLRSIKWDSFVEEMKYS